MLLFLCEKEPNAQQALSILSKITYKEEWTDTVEIILIELLLWAGLVFFFWALRDGLNHVEAELEARRGEQGSVSFTMSVVNFDRADEVREQIGRYRDAPIYRFAIISGKNYQFAHILPYASFGLLQPEDRCLAPGLVYTRY
jgi:hypothetical protein